MDSFILPAMVLIPLIGAFITLMLGKHQKSAVYVSFAFAVVDLILALYLMYEVDDLSQFDYSSSWFEAFGLTMNFMFAVDGLSILMVFLTAFLVVVCIPFSHKEQDRPHYFYALLLMMEVGLMGVYTSQDYFLFYIMWEVTLLPMYFLISWYGGPRRHYSAIKFLIYTHVASLVMLIGIFAMGFEAAAVNGEGVNFAFDYVHQACGSWSETFQTLVFGLLFFGFAVKMPTVPFHTWLPDAHTEAPTAGSVLLAGVMLKMGSYGIIRVCLTNFELGAQNWQDVMIFLGILSMIYGSYACIAQRDLKKMVAYSSVSHMGLVMIAMGCLTQTGIDFAVFQMFAHGLISAMLFMVCGMAGHNFGTRQIALLGGMAQKVPVYATFMMFAFMASLGLPGLMGFIGEFGIIYAFYEYLEANDMIWMLVFCLLNLLLTAGYYLFAMQRVLFGHLTTRIDTSKCHDVDKIEGIAMGAVALLVVLYGIWPDLGLDMIGYFSYPSWMVI
ncbi:MAG: complex I subunit 4 family protein [Methanomethylophilus sp.]|jgi:NADH-quinone oxidoreductase subunit M